MSDLENIPEVETIPKVETITTDKKSKNPNRVEWGKKLAKLSVVAKKNKKLGKQTNKKLESIKETTDEDIIVDKSSNKYLIAISMVGLLIGGAGLYYQKMIYNKEIVDKSEIVDEPEILVPSNNKSDVMMK